jgi:hypothetical protein
MCTRGPVHSPSITVLESERTFEDCQFEEGKVIIADTIESSVIGRKT